MMRKSVLLVLLASCAQAARFEPVAEPAAAAECELRLRQDAVVEIDSLCATIRPYFPDENWATATVRQKNYRTFPQDGWLNHSLELSGRTIATGRVGLRQDGVAALLDWHLAFTNSPTLMQGAVALTVPRTELEGATWRIDGKSGGFPSEPPKSPRLFGDTTGFLELKLPKHSRTLRFEFDRPVRVLAQDNRAWKADDVSFRLAVVSGGDIGAGYDCSCRVVSSDGLKVSASKLVKIVEGDDWTRIDYKKDILPGSALDFSKLGFIDAPAGKHGWLKNQGGHFVFENALERRVRFYGVNFCDTMNFPTHDEARTIVRRLAALGYNAIRLHHHDNWCVRNSADGETLNAANMERLDFLVAEGIKNGLYFTTDLYVSRRPPWRTLGIDRDGHADNISVVKALICTHEPAMRSWENFARNFLTHRNQYTGRTYAEEPGLPLISLINEGRLTESLRPLKADPECYAIFLKAWREWSGREDEPPALDWNKMDASLMAFFADLERKAYTRMSAFVRGLGAKAMLTNQNCAPHTQAMQTVRADLYDYVDDHFYVDHPVFLGKAWSSESRCPNENPLKKTTLPSLNCAFVRMYDRPFVITEWNFSGPGRYRGVGGILTGAVAAMQGWDGLWRFAYTHNIANMHDGSGSPGFFDVASDPLMQAGDRASILLFLRGDADTLAARTALVFDAEERTDGLTHGVAPKWSVAAWRTQVGSVRKGAAGLSGFDAVVEDSVRVHEAEDVPFTLAAPAKKPQLTIDREAGAFAIETPRTCGGFIPGGKFAAGPLAVRISGAPATVWVSSLTDAAVSSSPRLLLTHLTDVQGNGIEYVEPARKTRISWGKAPLVESGKADIVLMLADDRPREVWAIDTTGRRVAMVPSTTKNRLLRFTASTKSPADAVMLYEIIVQ